MIWVNDEVEVNVERFGLTFHLPKYANATDLLTTFDWDDQILLVTDCRHTPSLRHGYKPSIVLNPTDEIYNYSDLDYAFTCTNGFDYYANFGIETKGDIIFVTLNEFGREGDYDSYSEEVWSEDEQDWIPAPAPAPQPLLQAKR